MFNLDRATYGIDAPPVIKQLALTAIIILIIGGVGYKMIAGHYARIAMIVLFASIFFAAINLSFAIWMIWSSLVGKLIMRDRIIDLLDLKGNEKVLDVGCGRGLLLIGAARKLNQDGKAVGIDLWRNEDLSDNQELRTRENAVIEGVSDCVELVSGDMTKMKFSDDQFDAIVSSMAIHNVPTNEGRFQAIHEISRTLKTGGRLVILDFQHTQDYVQSLKKLGWQDIDLSCRYFTMFPPVRLVSGKKPML